MPLENGVEMLFSRRSLLDRVSLALTQAQSWRRIWVYEAQA